MGKYGLFPLILLLTWFAGLPLAQAQDRSKKMRPGANLPTQNTPFSPAVIRELNDKLLLGQGGEMGKRDNDTLMRSADFDRNLPGGLKRSFQLGSEERLKPGVNLVVNPFSGNREIKATYTIRIGARGAN